jgi:hypothetical protein
MVSHAAQPIEAYSPSQARTNRQPVYHPNTALGVIGHVVKTAGILAPLIIGEIVKEPDKRWRWIRISSVATALVAEGLYAQKVQQERSNREAQRERY